MPLSLADVLSAQAGGGPVYEGGPDANVTPGGVLSALGTTWPVKMGHDIVQGLMAPGNAYQSTPENPVTTEQMIAPAANLAGVISGGSYAAPAMKDASGMGIRAYHGSPYDFEKFDISKVGTGEGAQTYGHGLYFAENPAVAADYRRRLAGGSDKLIAGEAYNSKDPAHLAASLADTFKNKGGADTAIKELTADIANPNLTADQHAIYQRTVDLLSSGNPLLPVETKPRGKMYEVNINAEPGQFLQWDKQLPEQSESVKQAIASLGRTGNRGEDIYRGLATTAQRGPDWAPQTPYGQHFATNQLREAGIPGIRYLDQGSRNAAMLHIEPHEFLDGSPGFKVNGPKGDRVFDTHQEAQAFIDAHNTGATSNYVVFNPEIVDILKKYGLAGLTMGGVLSAVGQQPAPTQ